MIPLRPSFYITEENFQELVGNGLWTINDVPLDRLAQIKKFFAKVETVAVFASGLAPRAHTGSEPRVGGIDWVRLETNPKPREASLNVYHYLIGPHDGYGYPVYGPIRNGSIAPHHSELSDLDPYLGADDSPSETAS
jgi:hypothetical protein